MRTVGRRLAYPRIEAQASADALRRGLAIVDTSATFGWAISTGQRKGVYRFKTFEAMEQHRVNCLAHAMAQRRPRIETTKRSTDLDDATVQRAIEAQR